MFILRAIRWLLIRLVVLLIVLVAAGRVYQVVSERADLAEFPAPGTLVDVDGHLMHIHCKGSGSPTVIIEQGLQGVSYAWDDITEEIAPVTRVCGYDRVGLGYSEPIGHPTRATEVAELLQKLLTGSGIDDDIVLVGWSAGGVYIREYYRLYPQKVKAMLFVDSSHEQQQLRLTQSAEGGQDNTLVIAKYLAPIGVVRLSGLVRGQIERSPVSDNLKPRLIALYHQSHVIETMLNESNSFTLDTREPEPPASLGDLPLIVLTPGIQSGETASDQIDERQRARDEMQQELVALSTASRQIIATDSGHGIQNDQPDLLIASVNELVERVRDQPRVD